MSARLCQRFRRPHSVDDVEVGVGGEVGEHVDGDREGKPCSESELCGEEGDCLAPSIRGLAAQGFNDGCAGVVGLEELVKDETGIGRGVVWRSPVTESVGEGEQRLDYARAGLLVAGGVAGGVIFQEGLVREAEAV